MFGAVSVDVEGLRFETSPEDKPVSLNGTYDTTAKVNGTRCHKDIIAIQICTAPSCNVSQAKRTDWWQINVTSIYCSTNVRAVKFSFTVNEGLLQNCSCEPGNLSLHFKHISRGPNGNDIILSNKTYIPVVTGVTGTTVSTTVTADTDHKMTSHSGALVSGITPTHNLQFSHLFVSFLQIPLCYVVS